MMYVCTMKPNNNNNNNNNNNYKFEYVYKQKVPKPFSLQVTRQLILECMCKLALTSMCILTPPS